MTDTQQAESRSGKSSEQSFRVEAPQLTMPKGGGAIRGIGEKFTANPVTGTGSMSVPIYVSAGRSEFTPQLALSYDSGAGNGPFGFGCSMSLPAITRKTDKGLPQYIDRDESDIFILSGSEDLTPALTWQTGQWLRDITGPRTVYGSQYLIHRYRPRVESGFARIERWINVAVPQDTFWRSITKDNVTTWYGKTAASRIADPLDPSRVFSWLICESYDDKGNAMVWEYKTEDSTGVDVTQTHEKNRSDVSRSAQRYLKRVFYGNESPYFPDLTQPTPVPLPAAWRFEAVFDYGEHDLQKPLPQDNGPWGVRLDPFSTYRSTFEIRTYRLCRRVLMFHHFAEEPSAGQDCLVRATSLTYAPPPADPGQPVYSYLASALQSGYVSDGAGGYITNSLPPLEFEYSQAVIDDTVREIDRDSLENLPSGLDDARYRWIDLDGEGLSGILTEQAGAWFYKANLSPLNRQTIDGEQVTLARFAPVELVVSRPSLAALSRGRQRLMDLSGDGKLDLVEFDGAAPGFYERTDDANWLPFRSFECHPVLNWEDPNLRFIDLTGDGFPDLLISEDKAFRWYPSLSSEGFDTANRVPQAADEEKGPKLIFSDGTESIFLADLSGDGLTDVVRIRNGEICYWPNLGYGRFGAKVTMDASPRFDRPDLFDARRLRLADIDGSGNADIIYLASGAVDLYFNQSGNAWGQRQRLKQFPAVENISSVAALDLLGNGTACLVWSSPLPGNAGRSMRYIDLMGGQKPHLLTRATNNLGVDTVIQYAPSTKFYLQDKLAGTPWVTRLPFPIQVVEQIQAYDYVSRNLFITQYTYHHGFYDGVEREFRGFGRVDQLDTADFATLSASNSFPPAQNAQPASQIPPAYTRTWFHTGVFFDETVIARHFAGEYYSEAGLTASQLAAMLLPDTALPATILLPDGTRTAYDLSGEEMREASRALRGSILRQEVYALDGGTKAVLPYSVSERNYTIEALQPQGPNRYAAFFSHARETIDFQYERQLYKIAGTDVTDPRVTHAFTLATDAYGNVLQSASVGYGRRYADTSLGAADQAQQTALLGTYLQNTYTNAVVAAGSYRIPVTAQSSNYELLQIQPIANTVGVTNLFQFAELAGVIAASADGAHDVPFEDFNPTGLNPGQPYRRLIGSTRAYYRPDDMGAAAGNARALLPLGTLESLALAGLTYKLAFTPGLLTKVFQRGGTALLPTPATVLGSTAADGGGYVDLDGDGHFWIPSGRSFYLPAPASPAELSNARQHFFLPLRFEDAFGSATVAAYDSYDLLIARLTDPLGNVVSAVNDYRVLKPVLLTDANANQTAAAFDALGLVAATAVMGKSGQNQGDSLSGFNANVSQSELDAFYNAADPHTLAPPLLGNASARIVYDVNKFYRTRQSAPTDPTQWLPPFSATLQRETHLSALTAGQQSKLQISFSYSDGFGREIQRKRQAEPGPVQDGGPAFNPRWVGTGWTIYNNKAKPVRQYEPFFSQLAAGHQFEFGAITGVSPIFCYDPLLRTVAILHPNHTHQKTVFGPWNQATWDVNDTVAQDDPTSDPDIGDFFALLPTADYSPTWRVQRAGGSLGPEEQQAAAKAVLHANTPALAYFDTLGRTFLTVADNGAAGKYPTRTQLDIQNNQRSISDALGRKALVTDYSMIGASLHHASIEAGEHWALNDSAGKPIRSWDSRGHNVRVEYDALRRPLNSFVLGTDPVNSDPRTLSNEALFDKTEYGEGQAADQTFNLRTRIFRHSDTAGLITNQVTDPVTGQVVGFDFKGNLLGSSRQFLADYKALPDWSKAAPALAPDLWISTTQYDALNRVTSARTPDRSNFVPSYNEAALLQAIAVNLQGNAAATSFVGNIDYNAKGQRIQIDYGAAGTPPASTGYSYDPLTFRLMRLTTARLGFPADQQTVQDLAYTYDPAGNITHIQDNADIQNVVFFNNRRVEPSNDYTYDPIYRLTQASGREQLGLSGGVPGAPAPSSYNDVPRVQLTPAQGDGNALGTYTETYQYDNASNLLALVHSGNNPANPGWQRAYVYKEASALEPAKVSNRLTSTSISGSASLNEPYTHDLQGNMTSMPQLQAMQWDFANHLLMTRRQAVNNADGDGKLHAGERTYYVYNSTGERVRKTTESTTGVKTKERFYLAGFEVYREYDNAGNTTLERQTLHVMDDKRRVALVESQTVNAAAPNALPPPAIRFQFDNLLGSACLELDQAGAVITYEEYYPFGSTSYQAGRTLAEVSLKRYRYTGKERDEETGFSYHSARYYAPWIGRWTAPDPAGFLDGPNLYVYARCNPIVGVDPNGTDDQSPSGIIKQDPNKLPKELKRGAQKANQAVPPLPPHISHAPDVKLQPPKPHKTAPAKPAPDPDVKPPEPPPAFPPPPPPPPAPDEKVVTVNAPNSLYSSWTNSSAIASPGEVHVEGNSMTSGGTAGAGSTTQLSVRLGVSEHVELGAVGNLTLGDPNTGSGGGTLHIGKSDLDPDKTVSGGILQVTGGNGTDPSGNTSAVVSASASYLASKGGKTLPYENDFNAGISYSSFGSFGPGSTSVPHLLTLPVLFLHNSYFDAQHANSAFVEGLFAPGLAAGTLHAQTPLAGVRLGVGAGISSASDHTLFTLSANGFLDATSRGVGLGGALILTFGARTRAWGSDD